MPERERFDHEPPTLLLDVPVLNIDELDLEVEDLRAHVSLRAELANFVKINVRVDIYLDNVKLNIQGLEAQALLNVKLDRVLGTLERALEAIDRNPQILNEIVRDVDSTVGGAGLGVDQEARQTGQSVDRTPQPAEDAAGKVHEATSQAGGESGNVTKPAPSESEETEDEVDEEGNDANPNVPEEGVDRKSEDDSEVDANDAARRKAGELSVNLFRVRGTGSGGRVLVKDVERATKQPAADSAQD